MTPQPTSGPVNTDIGPEFYAELSHSSLNFPTAVCELLDNAIASTPKVPGAFRAEVILSPLSSGHLRIIVADDSVGMPRRVVADQAFRTGYKTRPSKAVSAQYAALNEHGFGMKFALAWLSQHSGYAISLRTMSRITGTAETTEVAGSLRTALNWRSIGVPEWNTGVVNCGQSPTRRQGTRVQVDLPIWQAGQGWIKEGIAEKTTIAEIGQCLVEHLGVVYRHLLLKHANSRLHVCWPDATGRISSTQVSPVSIPFLAGRSRFRNLVVHDGARVARIRYTWGELDPARPGSIFYRYNETTQGVDIVCNLKVIQQHVLEPIWRIVRSNMMNAYYGEISIDGDISTYVLKNEVDWGDPLVVAVAKAVASQGSPRPLVNGLRRAARPPPPPPPPPSWNFAVLGNDELRDLLAERLRVFEPTATVDTEANTWKDAAASVDDLPVDVLFNGSAGVTPMEVKAGSVEPQHVYQLRMYWDGLVLQGLRPKRGWLIGPGITNQGLYLLNYLKSQPDATGVNYLVDFCSWANFPWPRVNQRPSGQASSDEVRVFSSLM